VFGATPPAAAQAGTLAPSPAPERIRPRDEQPCAPGGPFPAGAEAGSEFSASASTTSTAAAPALAFYGVVSPNWTAEKVDTDTGCGALTAASGGSGCVSRVAVNNNSFAKGDANYIGTEVNGGFTWRFAPNAAFDLAGYYLFAGDALDMTEQLNGNAVKRSARDGYYAAARVRLSF
jgi:hypothetical protein